MEESILWTTNGVGDGAADITRAQWIDFFTMLFLRDNTTQGVAAGYLNALAVSSTGNNNVRVASGGGLVRGFLYRSTANVDHAVATPLADTGFRVVLRADWDLQTVRSDVVMNTTGVTDPPALSQVELDEWEISLGTGTITSGGVVAVTSAPTYLYYNTKVKTEMLDDLGVTAAKIAADAVTTDKVLDSNITNAKMADDSVNTAEIVNLAVTTGKIAEDAVTKAKLADVYPDFIGREGSNVSDWSAPGVDNFAVSQCEFQLGSAEIIMTSPNDGTTKVITFPEEFTLGIPNISLSVQKSVVTATSNARPTLVICTAGPTTTGMTIALYRRDASDTSEDLTAQIHWQAWSGNNS